MLLCMKLELQLMSDCENILVGFSVLHASSTLTAWRLNILQLFHRIISDSLVGLSFQAHEAVIADGTLNPQESVLILEILFQPKSLVLALNAVGRSLRFRGLDVEGNVVANVFVGDCLREFNISLT